MVLGIGTDLIEIERVRASLERFGDRFMERVFTPGEIRYCLGKKKGSAESFAAQVCGQGGGSEGAWDGDQPGCELAGDRGEEAAWGAADAALEWKSGGGGGGDGGGADVAEPDAWA